MVSEQKTWLFRGLIYILLVSGTWMVGTPPGFLSRSASTYFLLYTIANFLTKAFLILWSVFDFLQIFFVLRVRRRGVTGCNLSQFLVRARARKSKIESGV